MEGPGTSGVDKVMVTKGKRPLETGEGDGMEGPDTSGVDKVMVMKGKRPLEMGEGDGMEGPGTSGMDKVMVTKGKRPLEMGEGDNDNYLKRRNKRKPPKFPRVLLTALLIEALEQGPVQRRMRAIMKPLVVEVLERMFSNGQMSLPRQIKCAGSRTLRLHFTSKLAKSIFTRTKVKDYCELPVRVELRANGKLVTTGQESAAKLKVVVLEGDFSDEDWNREDFESHVVTGRKDKGPLLIGNLTITLKEGVGMIDDIKFTDNSSWIKSRKFMLGVQLIAELSECLSIHEGKSEAFQVIERRGAGYEKHYPPAPNDPVWRLENIKKDGPYHKKLMAIEILTVRDFYMSFIIRDPQKLRTTLGTRISDKELQDMLAHAQTCDFSDKPVEFMSDNDKVQQPVEEMYGTNSKIDSGKMPISEKLDELRGAESHEKESGAEKQYCNGNPATSMRHAVQDQQSSQRLPFSPSELLLSKPVICMSTYSSCEGFVLSASVEASKQITSPCYLSSPVLPQTGPAGLSEVVSCAPRYSSHEDVVSASVEATNCITSLCSDFLPLMSQTSQDRLFDEIFSKYTEQDENGDNQEPAQIHDSCMPGTSNLPGKAVSVVCQSFARSSADAFGMYKGCSLSNSSSILRTAIAIVGVMLRVREFVERASKEF